MNNTNGFKQLRELIRILEGNMVFSKSEVSCCGDASKSSTVYMGEMFELAYKNKEKMGVTKPMLGRI